MILYLIHRMFCNLWVILGTVFTRLGENPVCIKPEPIQHQNEKPRLQATRVLSFCEKDGIL